MRSVSSSPWWSWMALLAVPAIPSSMIAVASIATAWRSPLQRPRRIGQHQDPPPDPDRGRIPLARRADRARDAQPRRPPTRPARPNQPTDPSVEPHSSSHPLLAGGVRIWCRHSTRIRHNPPGQVNRGVRIFVLLLGAARAHRSRDLRRGEEVPTPGHRTGRAPWAPASGSGGAIPVQEEGVGDFVPPVRRQRVVRCGLFRWRRPAPRQPAHASR
jgi:hypothetical protein